MADAGRQTAQVGWSSNNNSMAIGPLEWEDWHKARASGDDPDHARFRENVAKVLHTPYIRRDVAAPFGAIGAKGVEDDLTPIEFMDGVLAYDSLGAVTAEERQEIIDNAAAVLMGEPLDDKSPAGQQGREMATMLLDVMKSQTPGNARALDASVSQQQFDQWQKQYGDDANFRLTENGQRNFTRQAAYDLLRAMQDGDHAPPYANNMSQGLNWIGGWFDRDASENYNDLASGPEPVGRAKVANRWWNQANMSRGTFRGDTFSDSAHFPGWSSTTGEGLGRIMSEDNSNRFARSSVPGRRFFSPSEASRNPAIQALAGLNDPSGQFSTANAIEVATKRTTPINPGLPPEEFRQLLGKREDLDQRGQHYERSFWPDVQAAKDFAIGTKTPRTWGTPLSEGVMKLPQNTLGDPMTIAFTAGTAGGGAILGGLASAGRGASTLGRMASVAKGAARGAGKGMYAAGADIITDTPYDVATEQAIGASSYGTLGEWMNAMGQPLTENSLMGGVQPGDPNLKQERDKRLRRYDDDWTDLIQKWGTAQSGYPTQKR